MNFSTKTEYLAAVAQWKLQYLELVKQVRTAKTDYKNAQRAYSTGKLSYSESSRAEYSAKQARYDAVKAIEDAVQERAAGRVEANRQWMAAQP